MTNIKVALITGAGRRIGAVITRMLHQAGFNVAIHYHQSRNDAQALANELNNIRSNSAILITADLNDIDHHQQMIATIKNTWEQLDLLVNNASKFMPTPIAATTTTQWQELMSTNLQAPFFLSQAALPLLQKSQGAIINITDVHAEKPLKNYSIYSISKAGLTMLTKALAKDLGPDVRVNAVAPGVTLWAENENTLTAAQKQKIINKTALKRIGEPQDIADAVLYLATAKYVTGQIIVVDGGRSLSM